jgi:hypothetical protein
MKDRNELYFKATVQCYMCGYDGYRSRDDIGKLFWRCEKCGRTFCSKCYIDKLGEAAYWGMIGGRTQTFCPQCAVEEKANRERIWGWTKEA